MKSSGGGNANRGKSNGKGRGKSVTAKQRRTARRVMKDIFGKSLPLIMLLLILLGVAGALLYRQFEPVRDFIDGLGIIPTTTTTTTAQRTHTDPDGGTLEAHFIDVGQGDSTLLLTADAAVLIDCGEVEYGDDVVAYLESCGVERLDYFIITHPDSDHMGCAAHILRNMEVGHFVINGKEKSTAFFRKALDAIEERGVDAMIAEAGDVISLGSLTLTVLSPTSDEVSGLSSNDSSLIIRADYGSRSFLFTGDAEAEGESLLLERCGEEMLRCDVFSAGHHGSKTSNSLALLQLVSPEYVVISCGEGNSYGHPHVQALDVFESVGANVLRTDLLGSIVFVTDGNGLEIRK